MDKSSETEKIGWSFFPLESVIDKISTNCKKIKQKEYLVEGKYPVIDQGADFIGGYTNDDSKVLLCDLPVVVFGDHTKILKLVRYHFVPGADGVKVLLPYKSILPELFVFFVQILLRKIPDKGYARHFQHLEKSEIPIPPLPEQRAIVAKLEKLFSELDNGIACLKKAQEQLKVYRQAVLKQAFEGELTKAWREQQTSLPSAQELLENINAEREQAAKLQWKKLKPVIPLTQAELDVLPELPEKWNLLKLGELTLGVEYGTSTKSLDSGDVPVIRMGNIQQGRIEWSNLAYTNDKADISKYRLTKGDVLFNRTNSPELVGKTAIYNGEMPAIFAGYLIRINQITVLLDCKYLNFWLNSHPAKVYGNSVKTDGVNQSNINGEKLKSYPLPYCSPQEQLQIIQEIETRLSVCDNIESTIRESLEKAEALRQSILKKAFEGKLLSEEELQITRNAPDWEPAEKLLERIRAEKRTARNKH